MLVEFTCTGKTPMLLHADDVEASDELMAWRKDPNNKGLSVPGDDRSPPWTWLTYLYTDGKHLALPQENLMAALRWGGAKIIMSKQTTFKATTQNGIFPTSNFFDLLVHGKKILLRALTDLRALDFAEQAEAVKKLGMRLFVKRAPIGRAKHVRVRLCLDSWAVTGQLTIDTVTFPQLSPDNLRRIGGMAGTGGLCDWRASSPKSPGGYGQFEWTQRILEKAAA